MHSRGQEKRRSETDRQTRLAERRTGVARAKEGDGGGRRLEVQVVAKVEMQVVLEVEVKV